MLTFVAFQDFFILINLIKEEKILVCKLFISHLSIHCCVSLSLTHSLWHFSIAKTFNLTIWSLLEKMKFASMKRRSCWIFYYFFSFSWSAECKAPWNCIFKINLFLHGWEREKEEKKASSLSFYSFCQWHDSIWVTCTMFSLICFIHACIHDKIFFQKIKITRHLASSWMTFKDIKVFNWFFFH